MAGIKRVIFEALGTFRMAEKIVKIGLVGFGTVGAGVAKIILEQSELIAAKTGIKLELACVVDKDTTSERPITLPAGLLTNDLNKLLGDASIEIAVELVGGTTFAKQLQLNMLKAGKDVVTANKALLAEAGRELINAAHDNDRCIAFEASCAGGIPIISALRTGLVANDITDMYGIVNGTCNYILSSMTAKNESFKDALAKAQKLGYAEADPTLDINGSDSTHKLVIMASIAFGYEIKLKDVYREGIEDVSIDDIRYASELGYCLKLLAIAQKDDQGKISLRVHPALISKDNSIAKVGGSFNVVSVFGNASGQVSFYGRGAGSMPTASAVVADILEVAIGNSKRTFQQMTFKPLDDSNEIIQKIDTLVSRFYIRLMCEDQPGVLSQWSRILADENISVAAVLQHEGKGPENTAPVVILTHPAKQKNINEALKKIKKLDSVGAKPICIRIVDIPEDN